MANERSSILTPTNGASNPFNGTRTLPETCSQPEESQLTTELRVLDTKVRYHDREIKKLRTWNRWLAGLLLVSTLGLAGAMIGATVGLRGAQQDLQSAQAQLEQQIRSLSTNRPSDQQLVELQRQITAFNQQIQELGADIQNLARELPVLSNSELEALQARLQALEASIRQNLSDQAIDQELEQLRETLRQMLQEQQARDTLSSAAPERADGVAAVPQSAPVITGLFPAPEALKAESEPEPTAVLVVSAP